MPFQSVQTLTARPGYKCCRPRIHYVYTIIRSIGWIFRIRKDELKYFLKHSESFKRASFASAPLMITRKCGSYADLNSKITV